jgi:ABC-type lipoprotein release transport system permease subunit
MARIFWQEQLAELGTAATLSAWRWRQQWFLLLLTAFGVLMAMTLVCALPLFSSVMITAGLRTTLRASPDNAKIEVHLGLSALSSTALAKATQQVASRFTQDLASNITTTGDLSEQIEVPSWLLTGTSSQVILHGASMRAAASHLQVLQGRLPSDNDTTTLEVALTQSAATDMHVHLGSDISLLGEAKAMTTSDNNVPQVYPQTLALHVVGIFQTLANDSYWQSQTFQEPPALPQAGFVPFHVLISSGPFLHWVDTLARAYQTRGISFTPSSTCFLTYTLSSEQLSYAHLDDLVNRLGQLQADVARMQNTNGSDIYNAVPAFPYIAGVSISGAALHDPLGPELLDALQNEVQLGQSTMLILTMQITGLVLFFISMLAQVQVERQAPALALLRSRGASGQQILATLFIQGFILCLLAGLLAPLLALEVVKLVAPLLLPATARDALNVLPATFSSLLNTIGLYSLAALCIVLGTQFLAFLTALGGSMLTLRREAARSTHRPLWLRLRLDLVLAVIALASYGFSFYTQGTQQLLSPQAQLLLTPLNLLAPVFLLLACVLFFLRLFPLLLRFFLRLIARRRDAPSMLAVAQIARAPRQSVRLTLLLGLALAFAIFTLVFAASQGQRAQDLAAYQAGADFSGYLPLNLRASNPTAQAQVMARYRALAGITSVSQGYAGQADIQVNAGSLNEFFRPLQVRAVDPQTFAQTAAWTPQDSTQTLNDLLTQLVAVRPQALRQHAVPAILSASTWQLLNLQPGEIFHIFTTDGTSDPINYLAVTSSAHIPPANESVESGMLVDFQALQAANAQHGETLQSNYIWLQSSANPPDLAQIHRELSTAPLTLSNLADRQALAQVNATNPLVLNLLAMLSVGVCTVLLLALLANLLLPILNLRARLTTFAFLRALGAAPVQVVRLLIWEQGLVLVTALFLGTLLGFPLALLAVPVLIVNGLPASGSSSGGANAIYLTQGLLPARVILPPSLLLALAILLALGILALFLLSRIVLRLTLSQQIRLNED